MLFGDGAGAVVLEPAAESGFLSFDIGADGGGGPQLNYPGSGTRPLQPGEKRFLQMNGREVFKFATRVLVSSAETGSGGRAGSRSTTSISTSPTRRTSGSSTTLSAD